MSTTDNTPSLFQPQPNPLQDAGATISPDGLYRYWLTRDWDDNKPSMVFVMLNPSTADAFTDDATIRRCRHFATRERCGGIIVVNLFAYRTPTPATMLRAHQCGTDIKGPRNRDYICGALDVAKRAGGPVVAAWGDWWRSKTSGRLSIPRIAVESLAHERGLTMVCLGESKHGSPNHPLYRPNDQPLTAWPS